VHADGEAGQLDQRLLAEAADRTHALAGQALFRARLLAGEMPPEIEEVFTALEPLYESAQFQIWRRGD